MKNKLTFSLLLSFFANPLFSQSNINQSLSINSDGAAPNASAMFDVQATDKGMLVPRMTTGQRTMIASPAPGLLVFDLTTGGFWFYNGTTWVDLSTPRRLADADGDTKVQVEESPDEDVIRFDLGGTENMVLRKNFSGYTRLELKDYDNNTFIGDDSGSGTFDPIVGPDGNEDSKSKGIGYSADENTAVGARTLYSMVDADYNTAIGFEAMYLSMNGKYNTANGHQALYSNYTGDKNTASGRQALYSNHSGNNNTASGTNALNNNTSGNSNAALGTHALFTNTTRSNLVAVGDSALYHNGLLASFAYDAIGNTALGSKAMYNNTIGNSNTATGLQVLYSNTTGNFNTANGWKALFLNQSGYSNTAVGAQTLYSNTLGYENAASGFNALYNNSTGYSNTASGAYALSTNTSGYQNTGFGSGSGNTSATNQNSTFIGYDADYTIGTFSNVFNSTALGYNSRVTADNEVRIGHSGILSICGFVNFTNCSDGRFKNSIKEDVIGLDFIKQLRPVTYQLDVKGLGRYLGESEPKEGAIERGIPKDQIRYTGFIAQEVEAAAKELGYDFSGVDAPKNETDLYGLRYAEFVVPLVKAMQEQQAEIESGKLEIEKLKAENKRLKKMEAQLEKISAALKGAGIAVEK